MKHQALVVLAALAGILVSNAGPLAQTALQPTPKPIVTAENEPWYEAGLPITVAGNTYYPAGPLVYFNGNEMVRSGHFRGIPLYSRTTLEPYSIVFAPLSGGLMQPYERRRAGEIADTVGSQSPSFPVVRSAEQAGMEYVPGAGMVQAQAPPSRVGEIVEHEMEADQPPQVVTGPAVGTSGSRPVVVGPLETARRPQGLNGVFVEIEGRRYFSDGAAVSYDEKLFTRAGEYHGFPIYRQRGDADTVFIPLRDGAKVLTPYRAR